MGSSIELECTLRGRHFDWRKEGDDEVPLTAFPLGNSLTIDDLQVDYGGRYICENEYRELEYIDLTVDGKLDVDLKSNNLNSHFFDLFMHRCTK